MHFKEDLIIIRHARSLANIGASTELDSKLSDYGHKQAQTVGNFLATELDLSGHSWYTSPFMRCLQTSHAIWQQHKQVCETFITFRVMPQLREYLNHSGAVGVHIPRAKDPQGMLDWSYFPEKGEEYHSEFNEHFLHRMHEAYELLAGKSVVVTHGLPALLLARIATENTRDVPMWDYSLDNASVTWIKKGRTIWHGKNMYHEIESWPKDHVYLKLLGNNAGQSK